MFGFDQQEGTIKDELLQLVGQTPEQTTDALDMLDAGNSRYLKDMKVNIKNVLVSEHLSEKETALLALSIAVNEQNAPLRAYFAQLAADKEATAEEIAEATACASLLASNNVTYRFRHMINKEGYNNLRMGIKMTIMGRPVTGKEFFELMSLAVSAVNGCEMCVGAHEESLIKLGATEARIWDAIRLSGVVVSLTKLVY
ncbi:carboxymuconolactone decarboxylase family protein [Pontibacter sp. G13]|uniref:carboxymuconolactone decarboxylase family protein n=1 Tax=Pontibacter sp. G13 TaxID=3074898 RepID=UPI00288A6F3C|nr:carboxymuconolactone decarboxylase family protein [Pontibacter sp. G13]WNJ19249.1 carboxymuconolactone decarboxylase family protein [Pontibacter sp. G13]